VVEQSFDSLGVRVANLEVEIEGAGGGTPAAASPAAVRPGDIVVGAHYDTVRGSPGADDNASAVAALLEISRLLADRRGKRTLRMVAFVNEEKPFDELGQMGSRRYAEALRARQAPIALMVSLEMLGCYSGAAGSQRYPPFLRRFYPDRADFIAFVSNWQCRRELARACAAFIAASDFPLQRLAAPVRLVPGVARSDHASFWLHGYPALMVTDTAFNRNPHYHAASDTPDTLDYPRLERVTQGLSAMLGTLAEI
jgi:Zn-dependent M28 family amino/carboxypeptidase